MKSRHRRKPRHPVGKSDRAATALAVVLGCALMLTLLVASAPQQPPRSGRLWFDDLGAPPTLDIAGKRALLTYAMAQLWGTATQPSLPSAIASDRAPRMVLLSLSDGKSPARVILGHGYGLRAALDDALARAHGTTDTLPEPSWLALDIVTSAQPATDATTTERLGLERSLYGLAFERDTGLAFLPGEIVAHTLIDNEQYLRPNKIVAYLSLRPRPGTEHPRWGVEPLPIHRFETVTLFAHLGDAAGAKATTSVYELYRGHRGFEEVDNEDLLTAATLAGDYLRRSVDAQGRFVYRYLPKSDTVPGDYNLVRHAGTVYAMMELYAMTEDPQLLLAGERAIAYLLDAVRPCPVEEGAGPAPADQSCIVEGSKIKLGANALTVVALAEHAKATGTDTHVRLCQRLGRWIVAAQDETGRFRIQRQSFPEGQISSFVSVYYPGEAILALVRLHELDGDEGWLDAAEAAAHYLIQGRDASLSDEQLPHDHWLLYGLNGLYRQRADPLYVKHALRLALAIARSQNRDPTVPDWLGSYYRPPRSTPTATRTEGLCATYRLAQDYGHADQADEILRAIRLGISFQLRTQFRPESALYLHDPQRALGGFHRSLTDYEIRIDYVQHNISALLGLYRIAQGD